MYPYTHLLFTWLIAEGSGHFSHAHALFAALLTLCIDLDHWFYHIQKTGNWSLKEAWSACADVDYSYRRFIHRPAGFVLVTILLLVLSDYTIFWSRLLAIAYYTHIVLDLVGNVCDKHVFHRYKIFTLFGFRTRVYYGELVLDGILSILLLPLLL